MKARFAVVAVLLVTGCAAAGTQKVPLPTSYEVHVSADFGPAAQEATLASLAEWEAKVGVAFHVVVTDDVCPTGTIEQGMESCFSVVAQSVVEIARDCQGTPDVVGCTFGTSAGQVIVVFNASPGDPATDHVLLHEVGHALGLQHVLDTAALMYPSVDGAAHVEPEDVAQYVSLRSLR